jgi:hypothetical protein
MKSKHFCVEILLESLDFTWIKNVFINLSKQWNIGNNLNNEAIIGNNLNSETIIGVYKSQEIWTGNGNVTRQLPVKLL